MKSSTPENLKAATPENLKSETPENFIKKEKIKEYIYKKNTCLYTIVLGNYESNINIFEPDRADKNITMVLFSDNPKFLEKCKDYHVIGVNIDTTGKCTKYLQRCIKANPAKYLPSGFEFSIYIDGNMTITNFDNIIDIGYKHMNMNYSLVCFKHPDRRDVSSEARVVISLKLEYENNVRKILNMIKNDNIVVNQLTETNLLFRNNNCNIDFANKWESLLTICKRDQIIFDYLLLLYKVKFIQLKHEIKVSITKKNVHSGDISNRFIKNNAEEASVINKTFGSTIQSRTASFTIDLTTTVVQRFLIGTSEGSDTITLPHLTHSWITGQQHVIIPYKNAPTTRKLFLNTGQKAGETGIQLHIMHNYAKTVVTGNSKYEMFEGGVYTCIYHHTSAETAIWYINIDGLYLSKNTKISL